MNSDWFLHILREMIKGHTTLSVLGKMSILKEKDTLTDFNFKISIKKSVFEDILSEEEKSMLWLESDDNE